MICLLDILSQEQAAHGRLRTIQKSLAKMALDSTAAALTGQALGEIINDCREADNELKIALCGEPK